MGSRAQMPASRVWLANQGQWYVCRRSHFMTIWLVTQHTCPALNILDCMNWLPVKVLSTCHPVAPAERPSNMCLMRGVIPGRQ